MIGKSIVYSFFFIFMISTLYGTFKQVIILRDLKNLKSKDIENIEIFRIDNRYNNKILLKSIKNKDKIKTFLLSLKATKIIDKTRSNRKINNNYLLEINFNDYSVLSLEIIDYNRPNGEVYLFINYWDDKYTNKMVLNNLIMKNTRLKSILESLNLPNWKENQPPNGN